MELTSVKCLINSISRFIHLATCCTSKMPTHKDFQNIANCLKHLKPLLDNVIDNKIPSDETLLKECEKLDSIVNEAREFLEKWTPKMSKILCVIKSDHLVGKIQSLSLEVSHFLEESYDSTSSLPDVQHCIQEFRNLKLEKLSQHIEEAIKRIKHGEVPQNEHVSAIMESLTFTLKHELLNESISLEKEKIKAENSNVKENLDRINQLINLVSYISDYMDKLESFDTINGSTKLASSEAEHKSEKAVSNKEECLSHSERNDEKWAHSSPEHLDSESAVSTDESRISDKNDNVSDTSSLDKLPDLSPLRPYNSSKTLREQTSYVNHNFSRFVSFQSELSCNELTTTSHVKHLVNDLTSQSIESQTSAAAELRFLAKHNTENRVIIGQSGAIPPLISLLHSDTEITQEHAVTALLNLSINENIKAIIAEERAIEPLIHVLRTGNAGAKENAAATLFSLSLIEELRIKIGSSDAVKELVNLLGSGTIRGKKDAATALFNLSIFHGNKARIVQAGAITHLVELLNPGKEMVDKSVALLANLSTISEGCSAIAKEGGIPVLVEIIETGSQRGKENAASTLLQVCINSAKYCRLVLQEGAVPPLVALSQSGTPRAKEKAQQLLSHFRTLREGSAGRGR